MEERGVTVDLEGEEMVKRMKYNNKAFADAMANAFARANVDSQEEFGNLFGVSQNAVFNWLAGSSFPDKVRWEKIREVTGIDPADYRISVQNTSAPQGNAATNATSSPQIVANGCGRISVQGDIHHAPSHQAMLDDDEAEILEMFRMIPAAGGLRAAVLRDCRRTLMGTIAKHANSCTQL